MLRVVTWNVNSIRSRLTHLTEFLTNHQPDIVLLQETKIEDANFPREPIEELGYNLAIHGQKTYNGVAILSKHPLENVSSGLPGETVEQSRFIEAFISLPDNEALRVISVYVPNGQDVTSEKFPYKLKFLDNLKEYAAKALQESAYVVIGGDYNVAPYPQDVYDPKRLDGTVCYHPLERERLRGLMHAGYYDAYRTLHSEDAGFTWWDYRQGALARNHGMRIDHLMISAPLVDALDGCVVLREERVRERPSDHAPLMCSLKLKQAA